MGLLSGDGCGGGVLGFRGGDLGLSLELESLRCLGDSSGHSMCERACNVRVHMLEFIHRGFRMLWWAKFDA